MADVVVFLCSYCHGRGKVYLPTDPPQVVECAQCITREYENRMWIEGLVR